MNKCTILFFIFVGAFFSVRAQAVAEGCACPENNYAPREAAAVYTFSQGNAIALCGYRITDEPNALYSEFVLSVCGTDQIIDFWDAMTVCRLYMQQDTLHVQTLYELPVGKDFAVEETVFLIEKLSLQGNEIERSMQLNRFLKKYNHSQIQQVLAHYRQLKREPSNEAMSILSRLFVAAISGSKEARQYLVKFRKDFHILDGAYSEAYHELLAMLAQWDA
ncbi:hypothetical protein PQ465_08210 [Sphingobacterium oryzagri]|uniref:DUF4476 domain-containing protein n=1 Tax=Sphingobacterium oryzagri TaxID=3025669 RepID=A0ABY7WL74_9SPHI|nr:hypothetical protein [Sphingobacterium sp. KACC 22765]WDF70351.1 hypothetical protein PQ465_08210 [Sphingobacterium sp. KACC 22765]